jgi:RNA polymerase sigma-54 factor
MLGLGLGTHLVQRQEQRLQQTLTPQQRQLVEILELPDHQLERYLDDLLASNPALKRIGDGPLRREGEMDKAFVAPADDDKPAWDATLRDEPDLMSELLNQLRLERTSEAERKAGFHIIGNLDHHGLLAMGLPEIAASAGVSLEEARRAQRIVMNRLEPVGCGADDLVHYLVFMVERKWPEDPFFADIVRNHLEDLKRGRLDRVADAMDMDVEDVEEYQAMLQEVESFPARGYATDAPAESVTPSMDVTFDALSGRWKVEMREAARARVIIDPRFEAELDKLPDGPEKEEKRRKLDEARWLVQNMAQRHSLVKQIADVAVAHQADFFARGAEHMRNLTMTSVANTLGRDTSTVSRAVAGRYLQHPGGVMALRDLFANRGSDADTSEAQLHAALMELIDNEDKKRPLSDDALSVALRRRHIHASRRTVAKHRDRMGIPNSRDRGKQRA